MRAAPFVVLETERLVLRRLVPDDLPALHALYRDPLVRRYFPDGTRTLEQTREELEWFLHGHPRQTELSLWATIERATDAFLGRCGLLPWTIDGAPELELAYLIDPTRWGEGFATEAARAIVGHAHEALGLERLIGLIDPDNERRASGWPRRLACASTATTSTSTVSAPSTRDRSSIRSVWRSFRAIRAHRLDE